jgi:hypothetical protein
MKKKKGKWTKGKEVWLYQYPFQWQALSIPFGDDSYEGIGKTPLEAIKNLYKDMKKTDIIYSEGVKMTLEEAQDIAFRMANLHSKKMTLEEIQHALVTLANFYEDYKHLIPKEER